LDVHFGQGEFEGWFGAQAFLEGAGVKGYVATDLGGCRIGWGRGGW
jgi:hypothetical protein